MTSIFTNSPVRILVVDDDEVIRILLKQFLEGEGYKVTVAENGEQALQATGAGIFDLIIMDIAMPGVDGSAVCQTITSSFDDPPPVLMLTALEDESFVDRSYQAGAVDYVRKPINWSVLKNRIYCIVGAYKARIELELLSRQYEMILDAAANGICGVDENRYISYLNPAGRIMLGYKEDDELSGYSYEQIFKISIPDSMDFNADCCPFFADQTLETSFYFDEVRMLRRDGISFPAEFKATTMVEKNRVVGGVIVFQDVTERHQAAELIRYMANHDSLTNLPNRNYLYERLPQAISLAKRHKRLLCMLFIDLDRFKPVNDRYGHAVGDMVLVKVARHLSELLRASDSVFRLGGDEFVLLLESATSVEGAELVADKAIEKLNQPIEVNGHVCHIGASVGIAVYPDDCDDPQTMLKHADIAMYEAKKKGRNCQHRFSGSESMDE